MLMKSRLDKIDLILDSREFSANEIEKKMVVSKEAFRVVDPMYLSKTFK
jgi:hypothetical protein